VGRRWKILGGGRKKHLIEEEVHTFSENIIITTRQFTFNTEETMEDSLWRK
jgi:hypothetical protein